MFEKEQELASLQKELRKSHESRIDDKSRGRLKKIASKKFRTCFISALSEFENEFGPEIWGHNMDNETLTEKQRDNRIRWNGVRKKILDKGNVQLRALNMEMDLHDIRFRGYVVNFRRIDDG
jgi:hypothetical protein